MFLEAIFFLIGICIPTRFEHLANATEIIFLSAAAFGLFFLYKMTRRVFLKWIFIVLLGTLWLTVFSEYQSHWQLLPNLEGKNVMMQGTIQSIPEKRLLSQSFEFQAKNLTINAVEEPVNALLALSWYKPYPSLKVGDEWQLQVRLKRPHGLSNPGSFDFDQSDFFKGIRAKGYVVNGSANQLLYSNKSHDIVGRVRQRLDAAVQKHLGDNPMTGIIRAVTVGDKSGITQAQWTVFQRTGTNHLIAISGLHIGLVSGLFFALVNFCWRCFPRLCLRMPSIRVAAFAGILAAFIYSALAGFEVPTQRALIMLIFFMGSLLFKKRLRPWHAWSWAMIVVLIVNPLNVLSPGFWMSFIAVGGLIYGLSGRLQEHGLWWKWGRAQWVMTLAIMPVTIIVFQQASLVAPLANALAIPWVGLIVVPLSLVACFFSFSWTISSVLFYVASKAMQGFWFVLKTLSSFPEVAWLHAMPNLYILTITVFGVFILLSPKGLPGRMLGALCLLPLIFYQAPRPAMNDFSLTLLDVGQGLSSVIQTKNHVLVFDTGADYGDGFNMGSVVLIPYLRDRGITHLDTLVVSHGDNDHIGGAASLLQQFPAKQVFTSVPDRFKTILPASSALSLCLSGQSWVWDGVSFQFLFPVPSLLGLDNNSSCVLKISNGTHSVLLTGDIEKPAEEYLVAHEKNDLSADILVAPHHGSKTSSTPDFIEAVNPKIVLFPVGYENKYHFPSSSVVARYQAMGVQAYDSSHDGAISFELSQASALPAPSLYRLSHWRFWSE
jgi:competence protein ComEC